MVKIYTTQYGPYAKDVNDKCFRAKRRKIRINNSQYFFENKKNIKEKWNDNRIKKSTPLKYQIQDKIIKKELKITYKPKEEISIITYVPPKKDEVIEPDVIDMEPEKSEIELLIQEEMDRGMIPTDDLSLQYGFFKKDDVLNLKFGIYKKDDPFDSNTYKESSTKNLTSDNNFIIS